MTTISTRIVDSTYVSTVGDTLIYASRLDWDRWYVVNQSGRWIAQCVGRRPKRLPQKIVAMIIAAYIRDHPQAIARIYFP